MSTNIPCLDSVLAQWWEGGVQSYGFAAGITQAANLVFGANPPFQLSDFLAIYPKFGTGTQSILTAAIRNGGAGYSVGDKLTVVSPNGGKGGVLFVTGTTPPGAITTFDTIPSGGTGTGYNPGNNFDTITDSILGTGATVDVLTITPFTGLVLPLIVLQLYLNLANASLIQPRWLDYWQLAMSLFVAHMATLYLISEGAPGTTPQQIAASGLAKGLNVSAAAGDVSKSVKYLEGWEDWGEWNLTIYGQQLMTYAAVIGMGPMYIYGG